MNGRLIGLWAVGLLCTELSLGQQVFIRSGDHVGRGITRKKNASCFVIAPDHVVSSPGKKDIVGFGGSTSEAIVRYSDSTNDVAILEIDGTGTPLCNLGWPDSASLDAVLAQASAGELLVANENGGREAIDVTLRSIEKRRIVIKPESEEDKLTEGLSGSVLTVQGKPVGLLLGVEGKVGEVVRFDFVNGLIAGFFDPGPTIEVIPAEVRSAFDRAVKAAANGFETAKGPAAYSDTQSSLEYYDSTIVWPGATKSQVGIYEDRPGMPNFISWKYPSFPTKEAGLAFYSAMQKVLTDVVPENWTVAEFPSSMRSGERHVIVKQKSGAGPILEVIFWKNEAESHVSVSIKTH